ncbi:MAG: hypothetical protein ABI679_16350, partial [Gemmatimonadota bacterium]
RHPLTFSFREATMSIRLHRYFSILSGAGLLLILACATTPPPGRVYVVDRPPRNRVEVVPAAPGRDFIWIGGYWRRAGAGWDWAPGHFAERPGHRGHWVPGRWVHERRGWYFMEGHWR